MILLGGTLFVFFVTVGLGLYYPLWVLLVKAFHELSVFESVNLIPWNIVFFTYWQAILSSAVSVLTGGAIAIVFHENTFRGKQIVNTICGVSFFFPSILVVLALLGLWGPRGWFGQFLGGQSFYGFKGILLAHLFLNFSLAFKSVGQALIELDRTEEMTALTLGASKWQTFRKVTLFKLKSSLAQSFLLSFLYCSSSFIVILTLGGGLHYSTIETAIYQAVKVDLDIPLAVSVAGIQFFVCLFSQLLCKPQKSRQLITKITYPRPLYQLRPGWNKKLVLGAVGLGLLILAVLPMVNLFASGVVGFKSLDWGDFLSASIRSVSLSLQVGLISVILCFSGSYLVRHSKNNFLKNVIYLTSTLPVAISSMVLGLAITLGFSGADWIKDKMVGVIIIQSISVLPLGFRILDESFSKIDNKIYQVAESLGASKIAQLVMLEFPLIKKSMALVFATGIGISLGETASLLLFESQGRLTLPLWLFRLMGTYQFDQAQAVGLVLMVLTILVFGAREKWQSSR